MAQTNCTPTLSQSARLYQERRVPGDRTTDRLPAPRSNLDRNRVHQIPLAAPFPLPEVQQTCSTNTPDSHRTKMWPYGEFELCSV